MNLSWWRCACAPSEQNSEHAAVHIQRDACETCVYIERNSNRGPFMVYLAPCGTTGGFFFLLFAFAAAHCRLLSAFAELAKWMSKLPRIFIECVRVHQVLVYYGRSTRSHSHVFFYFYSFSISFYSTYEVQWIHTHYSLFRFSLSLSSLLLIRSYSFIYSVSHSYEYELADANCFWLHILSRHTHAAHD